MRGDQCMLT